MFDFPPVGGFDSESLWNHRGFATIVEPSRYRKALTRYGDAQGLLHAWEIRRSWWRSWRIYRNFKENSERLVGRLFELLELGAQRGKQLVLCSSRKLRILQLMDQFFCFISTCQQFRSAGRRIFKRKGFVGCVNMLLQGCQRRPQKWNLR